MNIIVKPIQLFCLLLLPVSSVFASDPIKWEQTQSFPAEIFVPGGTYVASYTFINELPFTMATPLTIEKTNNAASEFSYDDLCSGKKLRHLEPCTVTIYLNPRVTGIKTVQLTEAYGNNRVPLPVSSTAASSGSGGTDILGATSTSLPATMSIEEQRPWKFTFTNEGTEPATGLNLTVLGASYSTSCVLSLSNIPPNNTCDVEGTYTATVTGPHTISATLSYAQGAPVEQITSTNGSGEDSGLVCKPAVGFAPETLINSSTPVTLLCTNKTGADITIDSHTTSYPPGNSQPGTFTLGAGGDNCTAQLLHNTASCQLSGTYVAPSTAATSITISLLVNYHTPSTSGLSSSTSTSTDVVTQINNLRTIHLVNQCNFDVWWSMVGGAISNSPTCTSDLDCNKGATCNVSAKLCYYNNYGPTTGSYHLVEHTGTATTQIIQTPASTLSDQILWKGLISASTQCTNGSSCLNNDCQSNGGLASCTAGVGFNQPATEAEFTFKLTDQGNVDSYDISNVNGFSMPISMATNQTVSDYSCGTAGNNQASGNLKACNFSNVVPPTNMYYWVSNTNTACSNQNTCSAGSQICGLAFDPSKNSFTKNCGDFLGYWAANQICQTEPGFTSPFGDNFSCNQVLSTPFPGNTYTLTQLLKCSPPLSYAPLFNSCYLDYSASYSSTELQQCCGCTDWAGIATPSAMCPAGQTDSQWDKYVKKLITWMKEACPTSYSYPYDDKASSFQCSASEATEYTITFCPGGGTGLPANKTDGR